MAKKYISYRGRLSLAKITNGVAGVMRDVGNVPNLTLAISVNKTEHTESQSGYDAVDLILYDATAVSLSGSLEELDKENLALVLSGKNVNVPTKTITGKSLGAVKAGDKIKLEGFNLTAVAVKGAADTAIDASKYKLDAVFGIITFLEDVASVVIDYTTGAVTHTVLASDFSQEYAISFSGVNKLNKNEKVFIQFHRAMKTPETSLDLIGSEDVTAVDIEFDILGDIDKEEDPALGIFGYIVYPNDPVTP